MNYTIELNSAHRDADFVSQAMSTKSPVVEIFSAMAEGKDLSKFGAVANKAVAHIKSLAQRAEMNDFAAIAELNTIKKYAIEPKLMEEIRLLGLDHIKDAKDMSRIFEDATISSVLFTPCKQVLVAAIWSNE